MQLCYDIFGVDIKKKSRKREYVYARACYYKLLRDKTACSLTSIGETLNKNHATVLHALREWEYMIKFDSRLEKLYLILEAQYMAEMERITNELNDESVDALKIKVMKLELELKKLRLVEKQFLKEKDKKAVVYNEYLDKLVLL